MPPGGNRDSQSEKNTPFCPKREQKVPGNWLRNHPVTIWKRRAENSSIMPGGDPQTTARRSVGRSPGVPAPQEVDRTVRKTSNESPLFESFPCDSESRALLSAKNARAPTSRLRCVRTALVQPGRRTDTQSALARRFSLSSFEGKLIVEVLAFIVGAFLRRARTKLGTSRRLPYNEGLPVRAARIAAAAPNSFAMQILAVPSAAPFSIQKRSSFAVSTQHLSNRSAISSVSSIKAPTKSMRAKRFAPLKRTRHFFRDGVRVLPPSPATGARARVEALRKGAESLQESWVPEFPSLRPVWIRKECS